MEHKRSNVKIVFALTHQNAPFGQTGLGEAIGMEGTAHKLLSNLRNKKTRSHTA